MKYNKALNTEYQWFVFIFIIALHKVKVTVQLVYVYSYVLCNICSNIDIYYIILRKL